jgi:serine/threonine protein kinase
MGGPSCNIPRLHVVTQHPAGSLYSVRELVEGSTLEQRAAEGSIDMLAGLSVITEVARVVQWVHEQGFVHRNLSPANVLVARDGMAWLIGFGRVRMLASSHQAPAGGGTLPEVDVQNLPHMLQWLCRALGKSVPAALMRVVDSGSVIGAGSFADALVGYAEDE